jgi:hypothetical protein
MPTHPAPLIDLAGRPLALRPCDHCPRLTYGETCPQALPCPACGRGPGRPCARPSGQGCGWHAERIAAAERADAAREAAGDPTLPTPWGAQPWQPPGWRDPAPRATQGQLFPRGSTA